MFRIFTRNWFRLDDQGRRVSDPHAHCSNHITVDSEQEARDFCREANNNRPKSWERLSRKYEYTSCTR